MVCLVSGGVHSSVVAWHALLSGYGASLVHFVVDDESIAQVAGLYAELSHRVDPRRLSLSVNEGDGLVEWLRRQEGSAVPMTGFHYECGRVPEPLRDRVHSPLALMSEEEILSSFASLSVKDYEHKRDWGAGEGRKGRWRSFGGARADVHGVIDGLS